jgi:hypothetical protein
MPEHPTRALRALALAAILAVPTLRARGEEPPSWLRDRGTGVATSMFGTYVKKGELLVYPFLELYYDHNAEYQLHELGYGPPEDVDYRARYTATEGLLFLGYGITDDLAIELEAAVISARLEKAPNDPSARPETIEESGLGDVEAQVRWRFRRETEKKPELFTYFETVFPLQKDETIIGTQDWEFKLGVGATRGYSWGTMTVRAAVEYDGAENKLEWGEYAIEYLRRLSPEFRFVALIEGVQLDEVELITEIQWHFNPRAFAKVNVGVGLTPNATDFAPELGVVFSF